jgi:uncharacterized protein with beta-barrel porin domain
MGGTRGFGRQALLAGVSVCAVLAATPADAAICSVDTATAGTAVVTCPSGIGLGVPGDNTAGLSFSTAAAAGGAINYGGIGSQGADGDALVITSETGVATYGVQALGFEARTYGGEGGAISYGGIGGDGGAAGALSFNNAALLTTVGSGSHALLAVSLGGTGGSVAFGGVAGAGGDAGDVTVTNSGELTTQGGGAHGMYVESAAGIGGSVNSGGVGGEGGAAGVVSVTHSGSVTTTGNGSHGIYARSSGGDSGIAVSGGVGGAGGQAGAVTVFSTGAITASGAGSYGILAEVVNDPPTIAFPDPGFPYPGFPDPGFPDPGFPEPEPEIEADVKVTVQDGVVSGGSGSGAGVKIDTATGIATLENLGTIGAASGTAASISGREVGINNYGTLNGNIVAAGTDDTVFSNFAGGILNSGTSLALNGGTLTNYGTLSPGGDGEIEATALQGKFAQTSTGIFTVDADWESGHSDRLDVVGAAELAGVVAVNAINFPDAEDRDNEGLTKSFTILTATLGVTDNGITVTDTAAVDYELLFPDENSVALHATINFLGSDEVATELLTSNQKSVGTALNQVVGGGGNADFVPELLDLETQGELGSALDQLTPAGDAAQNSSAMKTGSTFAGQLLSCRTLGEGDPNAFIREGQCLWVRANVRQLDNDGRNGETGFDETATFYSAGAQFDLGGPWRFGAGIGFEDGDLRTGSNAHSETERLHLGGVIKYNPGPLLLAASLSGGHGWSDNTRVISFGGFNDVATSESDQSFISGRLTAAYLLSSGHWYAKPQVDLAWTHLERDGYDERSTGGTALSVDGSDDTVFSVSPSIELGAQYALAFGGVARPYVKAGVTWVDTDTFVTSASFQGVPPGTGGFEIATTIDDVVADLGLGVDFLSESGTVLRVQYDGQFGDQTEQHGGSAKLSVPF